ncbi:MAG: P44/Msp2 family outer membrane protein [Wolbachia sp.]
MYFNFQDDNNNKSVNRKNLKRSDQSNKLQSKYGTLFAPNMAFGYSINSYRVELEGIYSVITANNCGFEFNGRTSWEQDL